MNNISLGENQTTLFLSFGKKCVDFGRKSVRLKIIIWNNIGTHRMVDRGCGYLDKKKKITLV